MLSQNIHRKIFVIGTLILALALPLSPFLVTLSQILLAVNWLIEPDLKSKLSILTHRKGLILIISVYFVHVIWFINSQDIQFGFHDLKIKLPLLVLPIIFGTSSPLSRKELLFTYHSFFIASLIAVFISTVIYFDLTTIKVNDIRDVSPIISQIRLSLIIVLAIYLIIYCLIFEYKFLFWPKYLYYIILGIFLIFIPLLGALTGLVILILVMPVSVILWLRIKRSQLNQIVGITIIFLIALGTVTYVFSAFNRYMNREMVDTSKVQKYTMNGNPYYNDLTINEYENQYPIWIHISYKELEQEWNRRSKFLYGGPDLKGQNISSTIIRYITSTGLTKDSIGVAALSEEDIRMIEDGYTNCIFKNRWSVYPRLYQVFWEIEHYIDGGNPSGHSLTQRVEYLKNSLRVIKRNFWFGTGTGDTNFEIMRQYELDKSKLEPIWRNRTHNQLVTFFLSFGLVGFCLIIICMIYGLFIERKNIDFIFICFLLIFLLSTINEDTLETQIGATYYAFFLSLFIFGRNLNADEYQGNSM
jgi:hypothetical protein